jgi:hypothetical protein
METSMNEKPQRIPTVRRWNELIALYGSPQAALERVVAAHDELERLKRAVRGCGLTPEKLVAA